MNLDNYDPSMGLVKFCNCNTSNCCCGDTGVHEWEWDETFASNTSMLSKQNLEVKFHPGYSTGTAAVRGNKLLEHGRHHFWEIKMMTLLYGTDVMIGVGTSKMDLNEISNTFCSLLGRDKESWGFSYKGSLQHNGEVRDYGGSFGQGSLVGVHLDTWKGTLQFFLNRKPLGIAFTGLRNVDLYPMMSSTAAQTKVRVTYSCSVPASLQMECLSILRPLQREYLRTVFPGLRYLSDSIFSQMLQKECDDDENDNFYFPSEIILDDFDFVLTGFNRRKRQKLIRANNCTSEMVPI